MREPAKRYQTAGALEHDLNRFIAGEPIEARRVGLLERSVKWCKRHPALATLAAALLLSVLLGVAGITWQWQKTLQALSIAKHNEAAAKANESIANANATKAAQNAKIADQQSDLAFELINKVLFQVTELLAQVPEAEKVRSEILHSVLDGLRRLSANLKRKSIVNEKIIVAHVDLGDLFLHLGRIDLENPIDDARAEYEIGHDLLKQWLRESPDDPRAHFQDWIINERLGDLFFAEGELERSHDHLQRAYDIAVQYKDDFASIGDYEDDQDFGLFSITFRLGTAEFRMFHLDEALQWYEQAEQIRSTAETAGKDIFPVESRDWYTNQLAERLAVIKCLPLVRADLDFAFTLEPAVCQRALYDCAAWCANDGDVDRAIAALERLLSIPDIEPDRMYDAACGFTRCIKALLRRADAQTTEVGKRIQDLGERAVSLLDRCFQGGYFDHINALNLVSMDPDLDPIRDRADFQDLFGRLREHSEALRTQK